MMPVNLAAVSCSPDVYRLGGVGFGSGTTGKPGRAWRWCLGAWWPDFGEVTSYGGVLLPGRPW